MLKWGSLSASHRRKIVELLSMGFFVFVDWKSWRWLAIFSTFFAFHIWELSLEF
ncbi:hypothetical protein BDR22DRAFT_836073 [Usnea florida]